MRYFNFQLFSVSCMIAAFIISLYAQGKAGKTLSTKTIKLHISLVSCIFEYAIKMQMLQNNPCRNVTFPASDKKEVEIYTLGEVRQLMNLFDKESDYNFKYVVFFKLALYTGFRRGELLGLEWKDFDWERGIVSVKRTSQWTKKYRQLQQTLLPKRLIFKNNGQITDKRKFR